MKFAIETVNLCKSFGAIRAISDLSMRMPAGSTYGLIGANGAGKTTLFAILCGFLFPGKGTAKVMNVPVQYWHRLHGRVGIMPQDAKLYAFRSVQDNLRYFARLQGFSMKQSKRKAAEVLEKVDMASWAKTPIRKLSHGMTKRVNLAQSLLGDPELLLLDEPTAGLDPVHAAEVRDLIRRLKGKCSLLISSHDLSELEDLCTHVGMMHHGRLMAAGTVEEITRENEEVFISGSFPAVALEKLQLLEDMEHHDLDRDGLRIRFNPRTQDPDRTVTAALNILITHGSIVHEVKRGGRLIEKYLEML